MGGVGDCKTARPQRVWDNIDSRGDDDPVFHRHTTTVVRAMDSTNRRLPMHSEVAKPQGLRRKALLKVCGLPPEKRTRLMKIEAARRGIRPKKG
jgi:hypothetical protein